MAWRTIHRNSGRIDRKCWANFIKIFYNKVFSLNYVLTRWGPTPILLAFRVSRKFFLALHQYFNAVEISTAGRLINWYFCRWLLPGQTLISFDCGCSPTKITVRVLGTITLPKPQPNRFWSEGQTSSQESRRSSEFRYSHYSQCLYGCNLITILGISWKQRLISCCLQYRPVECLFCVSEFGWQALLGHRFQLGRLLHHPPAGQTPGLLGQKRRWAEQNSQLWREQHSRLR